jgi:hypothetical protein
MRANTPPTITQQCASTHKPIHTTGSFIQYAHAKNIPHEEASGDLSYSETATPIVDLNNDSNDVTFVNQRIDYTLRCNTKTDPLRDRTAAKHYNEPYKSTITASSNEVLNSCEHPTLHVTPTTTTNPDACPNQTRTLL